MATITLHDVGKVYPDGTRAVTELGLVVEDGEFLVLVGPSGCGKTTALRMVAGLETITEGEVLIGGRVVNSVPPRDRDVAMVFQSYALYPHLSVRANIGFGLQLRKVAKDELNRRVEAAAATLGLTEYLDRKPRNLSGGQRQRVAMGRAIVRQPQAFLMDEPLSNLDAKLRVQMRAEIGKLQQDLKVTTLYVTHDQTEAMTLGHRVAVLNRGRLLQLAPPQELYDRPRNVFVAGFIGSPAMNFLVVTVGRDREGQLLLDVGHDTLVLSREQQRAWPGLAGYVGRQVVLGIRPEDIQDAAFGNPRTGQVLTATADLVEPLGSDLMAHLSVEGTAAQRLASFADLTRESPDRLNMSDRRAVIVARFNPRSRVRVGDRRPVAVALEQVHFFDPDSGDALAMENQPARGPGTPGEGPGPSPMTFPDPESDTSHPSRTETEKTS